MLMNEVGENVGRLEVGMDVTWGGMEWDEGERVKVCKWQGGG